MKKTSEKIYAKEIKTLKQVVPYQGRFRMVMYESNAKTVEEFVKVTGLHYPNTQHPWYEEHIKDIINFGKNKFEVTYIEPYTDYMLIH